MIQKVLASARKGYRSGAVKSLTGGTYGGGWSGFNQYGLYDQSGLDFDKEAGVRWDNSIVFSILSFAARCCNSVPLIVTRTDSKGNAETVPNHPAIALLAKPNPWYDGTLMTTGQVWGEASRGNSYVYKHRSPAGKLIALELMPEGTTYPYTYPGSGDWISEYRIATASGYIPAPPEDVLHLRWMTINPFWPQLGMAPLEGALPELVADKKSSRMEGALLTNSGVSPQAIFPKTFPDGVEMELGDDQRKQIADKIESTITRGGVGRPIVFNVPLDIKQLGFDPSQLMLKDVHDFAEERICAVYGIPPVVVGMGTGLEHSNNRASLETAVDYAVDSFVIPYLRHRSLQITENLIPELGEEGERIVYDESKIPALKLRLVREIIAKTGGPIETPNEGRAQVGLPGVEGGDTLRSAKGTGDPSREENGRVRKGTKRKQAEGDEDGAED